MASGFRGFIPVLHAGLELAQPSRVDQLGARHAIGVSASDELVEPCKLSRMGRDHDLPALFVGKAVLEAEPLQQDDPAPAQQRLRGAGRVVEAGMRHAAVVGGLMARDAVLLVEDENLGALVLEQRLACAGQSDDAGADDYQAHAQAIDGAAGRRATAASISACGSSRSSSFPAWKSA